MCCVVCRHVLQGGLWCLQRSKLSWQQMSQLSHWSDALTAQQLFHLASPPCLPACARLCLPACAPSPLPTIPG